LLLDDEGISGFLTEIEDEAKAIRSEISQIMMYMEGRIGWTELWLSTREDRQSMVDAYEEYHRAMKKASR